MENEQHEAKEEMRILTAERRKGEAKRGWGVRKLPGPVLFVRRYAEPEALKVTAWMWTCTRTRRN